MTPVAPVAPGSDRVRLAHAALDAALGLPDVVGPDAGAHGLLATWQGGARLPGVRVTAEPDGRYGVELGLRARVVPLGALAEAVRARVARDVGLAAMEPLLGSVTVEICDVVEDHELVVAPGVTP